MIFRQQSADTPAANRAAPSQSLISAASASSGAHSAGGGGTFTTTNGTATFAPATSMPAASSSSAMHSTGGAGTFASDVNATIAPVASMPAARIPTQTQRSSIITAGVRPMFHNVSESTPQPSSSTQAASRTAASRNQYGRMQALMDVNMDVDMDAPMGATNAMNYAGVYPVTAFPDSITQMNQQFNAWQADQWTSLSSQLQPPTVPVRIQFAPPQGMHSLSQHCLPQVDGPAGNNTHVSSTRGRGSRGRGARVNSRTAGSRDTRTHRQVDTEK